MEIKLLLSIILVLGFVSQCAALDVKVEGTAVKDFHRIGAWGWDVKVEKIISGPDDMQGKLISIYLTSANPVEYPPGSLDSNIKAGDGVEAFGQLETIEPGDYSILLVGSSDYYLRPATGKWMREISRLSKPQGIKRLHIEDNTEKVVRANFTPSGEYYPSQDAVYYEVSTQLLRKPNHPEQVLSMKRFN